MELHQLRYFVATAETGSASRAAKRCHVAQPSLSQQVRKLERTLGVDLFHRVGRGMDLTDAGKAFLPRARRILAEVHDAETRLHRDVETGVGTLAVGAIPTIAPYVLPKSLAALRKALPACELLVQESFTEMVVEGLLDGDLDCAVTSTPIDHELIEVEVLAEEELFVVVSNSHAARTASEISIAELREETTISLEEVHCLGRQIQGFCSAKHLNPRIACKTTQLTTVFELVALGLGFSIVPSSAAAMHGTRHWHYLRLRQERPTRQIAVAWRRDHRRGHSALAFAAALRTTLEHIVPPLPPPKRRGR